MPMRGGIIGDNAGCTCDRQSVIGGSLKETEDPAAARPAAPAADGLMFNEIYGEQRDKVHKRYAAHVNLRLARVVSLIGFDSVFTHGRGAWLWDQEGNR